MKSPIVRDLSLLYEPFKDTVEELIFNAKKQGLNVAPFETIRSVERQQSLYGEQASRIKTSNHQFGLAVDLYPITPSGGFYGGKRLDRWPHWAELGKIGKDLGLAWGGDWKSFKDYVHFENLYGAPRKMVIMQYYSHGIQRVWDYMDNWRKMI